MASLTEILAALDELPAIFSIIRRLEGQMAEQADVISEINDMTNRFGATLSTMAADVRSVGDRMAGLQGAITSGNQDAVRAAMDDLLPELGKFSALGDQLDQVGSALHTIASDPANPADVGDVPMSALVGGVDSASAGGAETEGTQGDTPDAVAPVQKLPTTTAETGGTAAVDSEGSTVPPQNTEEGSTGGTINPDADAPIQDPTGAGSQPDVTGPTDTAVGGAADVTTGESAGMPTGGGVDASQAGGGIGTSTPEEDATGGSTPPGGTPDQPIRRG
jgi:uncharacterized coiled-coil protein SlyX